MKQVPASDLEHCLTACPAEFWAPLRGGSLFLTGAGGFIGRWLAETFLAANERFELGARLWVLTRSAAQLREKLGGWATRCDLEIVEGRASDFAFPDAPLTAVVHSAIEYLPPRELYHEAVAGTRRTLELARASGASRYLFLSSGAVYGRQPLEVDRVAEDSVGSLRIGDPAAAYAEAKRAGEFLCALEHAAGGLETVSARAFAFLGPHQPLHLGAAVGNFLADALAGRPIQIAGDGTPLRSYLYAADLAVWLWHLLLRGRSGTAYNVGGAEALSIRALAELVAEVVEPGLEVRIAGTPVPGRPPERYLPDLTRAATELGLFPRIALREALAATAAWHRSLS